MFTALYYSSHKSSMLLLSFLYSRARKKKVICVKHTNMRFAHIDSHISTKFNELLQLFGDQPYHKRQPFPRRHTFCYTNFERKTFFCLLASFAKSVYQKQCFHGSPSKQECASGNPEIAMFGRRRGINFEQQSLIQPTGSIIRSRWGPNKRGGNYLVNIS